ncbi:DUF3800 domain-containing protein [Shinella yambaruensis]|uniref:DUF3800 domain-containing protein n=1 Tax=Shinella TaxID=323620 RepID=UPI001FD338F8|nr:MULTISPECIES: DUF3800 domain-containing protein [Shinella]CAI0340182.1 3-deoxy-D-manno-octulosonic acid transferase [Rhizobiaceae bacterium]CAK7258567.1 3-deoxy-D-manno-octulosonic acid transferase [Shinella sp. WSC3-e]MCJ8029508.1 DUF3800 domain-containing protein [Shinella yambaruensis]MCO5141044.1 DUF3800 domain-containing protein [Shinella sp.]MCU7983596.1 DUF3800 domain-containing protein [Shinella yambaruensis]
MFSDYIVYIDESGDHNLAQISPHYPIFVLAFCIFEKESYVTHTVPNFQRLKFRWFGHDAVVFHEREIRQQQVPFKFLQNEEKRARFHSDVNTLISESEFTVIATVINKEKLNGRYRTPDNPYEMSLQFCLERLHRFLIEKGQAERTTYCIFERRGKKEDASIELEFRRICDGGNFKGIKINCLDIQFLDKAANSSGLQISDLIARPIGLAELRPNQPNRAYDIIQRKFRRSATGLVKGYGLKTFP